MYKLIFWNFFWSGYKNWLWGLVIATYMWMYVHQSTCSQSTKYSLTVGHTIIWGFIWIAKLSLTPTIHHCWSDFFSPPLWDWSTMGPASLSTQHRSDISVHPLSIWHLHPSTVGLASSLLLLRNVSLHIVHVACMDVPIVLSWRLLFSFDENKYSQVHSMWDNIEIPLFWSCAFAKLAAHKSILHFNLSVVNGVHLQEFGGMGHKGRERAEGLWCGDSQNKGKWGEYIRLGKIVWNTQKIDNRQ